GASWPSPPASNNAQTACQRNKNVFSTPYARQTAVLRRTRVRRRARRGNPVPRNGSNFPLGPSWSSASRRELRVRSPAELAEVRHALLEERADRLDVLG